eukprot:TRINITY_DN4726_c0_g1_i2.p1 TRINITY_DN4726_c0_g1~~TRINITY_DN4726_c0_g1_i2.p1  ORF type:complete len:217 (-),score=29.19 TRINITY_DN4726_c0_g1_i2:56-706(-)
MYSGSEDGSIKIWDVRNPNPIHDFEYKEPCTSLVLHPSQKFIMSSHQNGEIRVLDTQAGSVIHSFFPDGESSVQSVSIDSTGRNFCAVNNKGMAMLYNIENDLTSFKELKKWKAHDKYVLKCVFSPNGKLLATTSADHTTKIWNLSDYSNISLQGHTRWVWDCAYSSDSTYLITVSSDNMVYLWDLSQGNEPLRRFTAHRKAVTCVALHDLEEEGQ